MRASIYLSKKYDKDLFSIFTEGQWMKDGNWLVEDINYELKELIREGLKYRDINNVKVRQKEIKEKVETIKELVEDKAVVVNSENSVIPSSITVNNKIVDLSSLEKKVESKSSEEIKNKLLNM